jgi:hypothetical protein
MLTSMPLPSREPVAVLAPRPAVADARQRQREHALAARAHEFEGAALLDALHDLGYEDEDIVLCSRQSMVRPNALVHELRFERVPQRRVVVTLNLGLLGCESPLPSYILKLNESSTDRLVPFFEYFDHSLLRSRLRMQWPERDPELGCDWASTRRNVSKLVRMDSPATAHWLFRHVYPELDVSVRRQPTRRTIATEPVVLGRTAIGDGSALGGVTDVLCGGLAATIVTTNPLTTTGQPWQEEAARRLRDQLLPQIIDSEMGLTVTLVIRDRPSFLMLSPSSFLGLQPLVSGSSATKVLVFDGPIQDIGVHARLLGQLTAAPATTATPAAPPQMLVDAALVPRHGALPPAPSPDAVDERGVVEDEYLIRIR